MGGFHKRVLVMICNHTTQVHNDVSFYRRLLLKCDRIVIPMILQIKILNRIREGHQGITKCRARARSVWWQGLSRDIESFVNRCNVYVKYYIRPTESLLQSTLPHCPGQKVARDLFYFNNCVYLLIIDCFSR